MNTKQASGASSEPASGRGHDTTAIVELYQRLVRRRLAAGPAILDAPITMAQAKVLFLLEMAGELRMSDVAGRLGVSLSTASGLVERLVEAGLVSRHDDPVDRRQVVVAATGEGAALVDRFRQLGVGELQELLADLSDEELGHVRRAFEALDRAVERAAGRRA